MQHEILIQFSHWVFRWRVYWARFDNWSIQVLNHEWITVCNNCSLAFMIRLPKVFCQEPWRTRGCQQCVPLLSTGGPAMAALFAAVFLLVPFLGQQIARWGCMNCILSGWDVRKSLRRTRSTSKFVYAESITYVSAIYAWNCVWVMLRG